MKNDRQLPLLSSRLAAATEHPVLVVQLRTSDLAAKNGELVAQHYDLELLELPRAQPQRRYRQSTLKQQVQQRHDQAAASLHSNPKKPTLRSRTPNSDAPSRAPNEITYPTR
jgi:hypothetical protein